MIFTLKDEFGVRLSSPCIEIDRLTNMDRLPRRSSVVDVDAPWPRPGHGRT